MRNMSAQENRLIFQAQQLDTLLTQKYGAKVQQAGGLEALGKADVHGSYLDAAYVQAAFAIIAKLNNPDGGGGEPLPVTNIIAASETPLAAQQGV
jgi:hypothetical protein